MTRRLRQIFLFLTAAVLSCAMLSGCGRKADRQEDSKITIAEDGTIIFSENQEENFKKLGEGRSELRKSEWEIPIDKPVIFHDAEGVQVSGNDIEILQGLAEFIE